MRLCPLFSGSTGNCIFVEGGGVRLLVDAGLPGSTVASALQAVGVPVQSLSAILVTHEHRDHVAGVGVLARRLKIPVYANAPTWEGMAPITGQVPPQLQRVFQTGRDFFIKSLGILPFKTPHDAAESVGYAFFEKGATAGILTDVGHIEPGLLEPLYGAGLVLLEANHDEDMLMAGSYPYPLKRRILGQTGHLCNLEAGRALALLHRTGVKRAVLCHLSKENNYESLAMQTVRSQLRAQDIPDTEFALCVAHRERTSGVFEVPTC